MPWKKNFAVYPSLKSIYFEEHLRTAASNKFEKFFQKNMYTTVEIF